jgi:hypothetical protein
MKLNTSQLFLIVFLGIISLNSCSPILTPFSQKLYEENKWTEDELKQIQFYLSDAIVLHRKVSEGETKITNGRIKTINGEKVEEVVFRKGTPGVFVFAPKENRLAVSFENGENPKFLIFGPNPKLGERYVLFGKEWNRKSGIVTYDESEYFTTSESAFSGLMVDLQRANRLQRNTRVVKGSKVN